MKRMLGVCLGVLATIVACGGSTTSTTNDGGAGGDGGASDGGSKPRFEDLVACSGPGTCELGAKGCCGLNCQPDSQLVAIRRGASQDLVKATCDQTGPVPCPACARQIDGDIQAFCVQNTCKVVDLRTDAISACTTDAECVLRYGTCCQPCDGGATNELVAIAKGQENALAAQLCTGAEACDQCLPAFPPGTKAHCNVGTGHCEVLGK